MISIKTRSLSDEYMDNSEFSDEDIKASFQMIGRVNKYLGGIPAILSHLKRYSQKWVAGERIHILDIGTGAADIPVAIIQWARKYQFNIRISAFDSKEKILNYAKKHLSGYPEIKLIHGNALNLPFRENSFDYLISSMLLHHLKDEKIITLLQRMNFITRRGMIINDLSRKRRAYYWVTLFTLLSSKIHVRRDAQLSVLRGFKKDELEYYIKQSGLDYVSIYPHYGHRWVIAGEKNRLKRVV